MRVSACLPVLLLTAGCSAAPTRATLPVPAAATRHVVRVRVIENGRTVIRQVPLEQYVEAAAVSEFAPPSGDPAIVEGMLEVQAIVTRTYALANLRRHEREGFDLCSTTHCQIYDPERLRTSRWADVSAQAVRKTSGVVLWFDGAPADALFHADCGGRTSAAADVWGGITRPYLVSRADDGPAVNAHRAWRYEVKRDALLRALNSDPRTLVGDRLDTIEVLDRDNSGRAERVALHGRRESIVRGEDLREVLSRALGVLTVRSTLFDVDRNGLVFVFTGRGFGHGVGLCQAGALARIRAGETLRAVLQHYYPGTILVTTTAGRG